MKRLVAIPLGAALVFGLGACTADTGGADAGPAELLIWVDTVREPAAQAYAASVEGEIEVTIEVVDTSETASRIQLFNTTGSGWPDVVFANDPNEVAIWADPSSGYAANLSELLPAEVFDDYGAANDWCLIDGSYYCFKNDLAQTVLWYDTVLFEELGLTVPTTMEEFATEALKLQGTGYSAGAIGDQGFYAGYLWPSGCPMSEVVDSTTVRIDASAEECTRVAELVQPLVDAGVLDTRSSFDAGFLAEVAQAGKLAMTFGPSWFGEFVIKPESSFAVPAGRIAAAPMPIWDGNDAAYSGEWGGGIWVASAKSAFPQEAAEAAAFLAADPGIAAEAVTYPASQSAAEVWIDIRSTDPYYASDPTVAMIEQAALINPKGVNPVRFANGAEIGAVLQTEINAGTPIMEAIEKFLAALENIAPGSGYEVVR